MESLGNREITVGQVISRAQSNLEAMIEHYLDPETGYVSRRIPFRQAEMSDDYDHLARTREWSFGDGDAEE